MQPEIIVGGVMLSTIMPWGGLEWVTCWPGGTESIQFEVARDHQMFHRGEVLVEVDLGGIRLACGTLVEPTRGEPLTAEGLHRKAEDYGALDFFREAILTPGDTVDSAIARGMPWVWPYPSYRYAATGYINPPGSIDVALDPDQPHSVAQILDASAQAWGMEWGVGPDRLLTMVPWQPPSVHLLPGVDGLATSRDGYADQLYARYLDAGTGVFKTIGAHDTGAHDRWGHVERMLTDPLAEGAPITTLQAQQLVDGLLVQGRSQIGWTAPLEVQFGDVVTDRSQPVDIRRLGRPGQTIRVHGLDLDCADLSGRTWTDMRIARTRHSGAVVTIEPQGLSSPMNDALAGVA